MRDANRRRGAAAAGAVFLVAIASVTAFLFHAARGRAGRGQGSDPSDEETDPGRSGWRGYAAGQPAVPADEPADEVRNPASAPSAAGRPVDSALAAWRTAILVKDARTVIAMDLAFTGDPRRFTPALLKSAEGDDDERVRAFSTRVLGKLGSPALADAFQRLLDDKSPYVRENAAWALGQLAVRTDGRQAAQPVLAELRRVRSQDPAADVRTAAAGALKKLE
jgi:hypothetical protein